MDYKIHFEYKGIGKEASLAREKVIQAQKAGEKKGVTSIPELNKDLVNSIHKLIDANRALETALKKSAGRTAGTGSPGSEGFSGGGKGGGGSGIGSIGAAGIGIGALIAATGFAIQKITQIGHAYMDLAGQQLSSSAFGGFRTGVGIYTGAERSAGFSAYSRITGTFANEQDKSGNFKFQDLVKNDSLYAARRVGAGYGMSAEESYSLAGHFASAKGNLGVTAAQAVGGGMQSQLPQLLSALANTLQDAVTAGLDASEMAKNIGKETTALVMQTPRKNVDTVLSMIHSFQAVKEGVGRGRYGSSIEAMYTTQASREILMEKLKDPKFVEDLYKNQQIDENQRSKILGMGGKGDYNRLQALIGSSTANVLTENISQETSSPELMKQVMQLVQQSWGTSIEGKNQFKMFANSVNWSQSNKQIDILAKYANNEITTEEYNKQLLAGEKEIEKRAGTMEGGKAGLGKRLQITDQDFLIKHGQAFANSTILMNKEMKNLIESLAPAPEAIKELTNGIVNLSKGIKTVINFIKNSFGSVTETIVKGGYDGGM